MNRKWFTGILSLILFCTVLSSTSWAGQVITQDERSWAKQVLKEEKTIQAVKGRNTLAVLYFKNKTGQSDLDPVQKGLALMLITDLSTVEGIQVIERIKMQALAEEMGLGVSGLVESNTAPRVGKLLGAQWLVGGDISGQPVQLKVQSDLLDVPDEKIFGQSGTQGQLSELFRMEKDILFETIKLLKIEITPQKEKELRKPCSTNIKALKDLFKGIDESDKGNYEKAAAFYENALKEDSNICIARGAWNELQELGLIKPVPKRNKELLQSLRDQTSLTNQLTPKDEVKRVPTPKDIKSTIDIDVHFPGD